MVFLEFDDFFEFTEGFGFFGFDGVVGIEDGLEFFFLFEDGAHGLAVVEGEAALLQPGMAFEFDRLARDWIY